MSDIYAGIGKRIRELRLEKGMTQEILSERAGITANFLCLIEGGRKKASVATIGKLADAMNIPLKEFFDYSRSVPAGRFKKGGYEKKLRIMLEDMDSAEQLMVMEVVKKLKKYGRKRRKKG
ncbi:MAG TPA: XRE family transcriptional regulator [bacterium]|nr:XRE family transcriptional regulator [bacterium]